MKTLFANPTVRLIARAILAGVLAFGAQLQSSTNWDNSVIRAAAIAGVFAAVECLTPLNALVGLGKKPAAHMLTLSGSTMPHTGHGGHAGTVQVTPIPETRARCRRLGRHVEHDERSRAYAIRDDTPPASAVLWDRHGRPFNQGDLGSCTGNATAGILNTDPFRATRKGRLLTEKDAVAIYELATTLDAISGSYPPDDTGSSGLAACKAAKKLGYIAGYKHAFSIRSALAALKNGPVITGVNWYEGFDTPDPNGLVEISGQVRGGHEFEVIGYDPATGLVTAVNSWGRSWGDHGRFYFTADTWAQLLAEQGDVTVPLPLGSAS